MCVGIVLSHTYFASIGISTLEFSLFGLNFLNIFTLVNKDHYNKDLNYNPYYLGVLKSLDIFYGGFYGLFWWLPTIIDHKSDGNFPYFI